ncbi:transglutaminase-like cysteine peptidase [Rhizobium sp.]
MAVKSFIVGLCLAFAVATNAFADIEFLIPKRGPFMATGAKTSQPIGHFKFCQSRPDECAVASPLKRRAQVTDAGWAAIREINTSVNDRIEPVTDDELYGQDEFWAYPTNAGDCEDYVLLKRKELLSRGFAEADLLITVVRRYDGTGHAVLTVSTSEGDFILDNLEPTVKPWSQTPYHYLKRQSATHTGRWVEIENCPDDIPVSSIQK